jgi:CubicO group peptidase (beta-lactamase class C family)
LGAVVAFSVAVQAARAAPSPEALRALEADLTELAINRNLPSLTAAVSVGGETAWTFSYGFADKARRVRATTETPYSLASISKPITAAAVMRLVEAGRIDLDKPANDYLPGAKLTAIRGRAEDATVRRLLSHTAGLPIYFLYYDRDTGPPPGMEAGIRLYGELISPPGETHHYSNFGFSMASYIVEHLTGRSFGEYVREAVFSPLGMTGGSVATYGRMPPRAAVRYAPNGLPAPDYANIHAGSGDVFASGRDLLAFGNAFLRPAPGFISETSKAAMHRREAPASLSGDAYGLGMRITCRAGYETFGHTGGMVGVSTELIIAPQQDLVAVVLLNSGDGAARADAVRAVLGVFAPEMAPGAKLPLGAGVTGAWRGTFTLPGGVATPITLKISAGGELAAKLSGRSVQIAPRAPDLNDYFELTIKDPTINGRAELEGPSTVRLRLRLVDGELVGYAALMERAAPDRTAGAYAAALTLNRDPGAPAAAPRPAPPRPVGGCPGAAAAP